MSYSVNSLRGDHTGKSVSSPPSAHREKSCRVRSCLKQTTTCQYFESQRGGSKVSFHGQVTVVQAEEDVIVKDEEGNEFCQKWGALLRPSKNSQSVERTDSPKWQAEGKEAEILALHRRIQKLKKHFQIQEQTLHSVAHLFEKPEELPAHLQEEAINASVQENYQHHLERLEGNLRILTREYHRLTRPKRQDSDAAYIANLQARREEGPTTTLIVATLLGILAAGVTGAVLARRIFTA